MAQPRSPARRPWRGRHLAAAATLVAGLASVWSAVAQTAALPMPPLPAARPAALAVVPSPQPAQAIQVQQQLGLFGSVEFLGGSLSAIPQWTSVVQRIQAEQASLLACDGNPGACPSPQVTAWRAKIQSLRGRHGLAQLQEINRFLNQTVRYRTDDQVYGRSDYWASPLEFLRNTGDCEDYAIAKFVSLLELGFTNDQMRIVVLKDTLRNLGHAVLAVNLDGRTYILDNLFDTVVGHESLTQYQPQYSVNLTTRWAHVTSPGLRNQLAATN